MSEELKHPDPLHPMNAVAGVGPFFGGKKKKVEEPEEEVPKKKKKVKKAE